MDQEEGVVTDLIVNGMIILAVWLVCLAVVLPVGWVIGKFVRNNYWR